MSKHQLDEATSKMPQQSTESIRERVELYSDYYYYSEQQSGIDNRTKTFLFRNLLNLVHGESILEFGFVDGLFTDMLLAAGHKVTIIEGATSHVRLAAKKYHENPSVRIKHALFETFSDNQRYDTVIAGDMIQFMADPVTFLRRCQDFMAPGATFLISTPNCRSLHRRIGAALHGGDPAAITPHERQTGTVRLYDMHGLRGVLRQAGFQVNLLRGCFLKPLSSSQMASWDDALLEAFDAVGEEFGDMAWFLYAACSAR